MSFSWRSGEISKMRLRTRSALFAASSLFLATSAFGATVDETRSLGTAALRWESRQSIIGPTSGNIGSTGGSFGVWVTVSANLDPPKEVSKPLLLVDMPKGAVVEATWSDDKGIDLVLVDGAPKAGTFKVEHTLAPHLTVFVKAFGNTLPAYDYNAEGLITKIPGSSWNYLGTGTAQFDPWGFTLVPTGLTAPALANAQLFGIPIPNIGGSNPVLEGTIALNATTSKTTTFDYQTTEVVLYGSGTVLDGTKRSLRLPTTDADYLDVPAVAKGRIKYEGKLVVRPSVTITDIAGYSLPFSLVLDPGSALGVELPFASPDRGIPVEFQSATFHIPLPNVKAQKSLDFGNVQLGKSDSKKADIKNTGEMQATVSFKSSDPQFVVVSGKQIAGSKGSYDLEVKFTPVSTGPASADITVESNDPNEPMQVIKVTGNGARLEEPGTSDTTGAQGNGAVDSGCGCRTTTPAPTGFAGVGVVGLGLAALLRRRKKS